MTSSVVMATYNGALYVREQIVSILDAEELPDEIIIVDDRSTDETLGIIQTTLASYPKVRSRVLQNDVNLGATSSFVRGITASIGDVILLADQDDRWRADKLARMMDEFRNDPGTTMAYSDGAITDADLRPDGRTIFSSRSKADLNHGADRNLFELVVNPDVKGCSMALNGNFARHLFKTSHPSFAEYWGHDHWAALFAFGIGKVSVIPDILFFHRFHRSNSSGDVGFDPFKRNHIKRFLTRSLSQRKDHFVQRYKIAITTAENYGQTYSPPLLRALREVLAVYEERYQITLLAQPLRLNRAFRLWQNGLYTQYFNGIWTLLRDILL